MESKPEYLLGKIPFYKKPFHSGFVLPISKEDIEKQLLDLPEEYILDIKGIRILPGSKKQLKVCKNWQMYGEYAVGFISLYPFPKKLMNIQLKKLPAPHLQRELKRVGVQFKNIKKRWYQVFSEQALRSFYLNDVLIHEIGHHVDRFNQHKSYYQKEKFAEAFADAFGFKNKKRNGNTTIHKTQ